MTAAPLLVQKFGGTSVSTPERRALVVGHVRAALAEGYRVAVVVSAMGRRGDPYATDTLLDLLRGDGGPVDPRDYDLMFSCGEAIAVAVICQALRRAGIPTQGLTAAQAGIYTDGRHQRAEISRIDTARLRTVIDGGEVPVVAGCQGVARETLDITILGRGGSDTSAVALGVALGAAMVEIFTDVAGIATADPRLVPNAALLRHVSFAAAYELARFGATVVHSRAVRTGWLAGAPIVIRSTFSSAAGTRIDDAPDEQPIVGLGVLAGLHSFVLGARKAAPADKERWERDGIASLRDSATGALVIGVIEERLPELRDQLSVVGLEPVAELPAQSWLSVVGEAAALDALDLSPALGSATVAFRERTDRRLTIVVGDEQRLAVARRLHDLAFSTPRSSTPGPPPVPRRRSTTALEEV